MSASSGKRPFILLFALAAVCALAILTRLRRDHATGSDPAAIESPINQELIDQFVALESRENEINKTIWAGEMIAQECGRVFENLWDSLNASTNKFALLAAFPFGELVLGKWRSSETITPGLPRLQMSSVSSRATL